MKALSGEPLRKQPDKLSAEDVLQARLLYGCSGLIENYMDKHCHPPNLDSKWILDVLTTGSSKTWTILLCINVTENITDRI